MKTKNILSIWTGEFNTEADFYKYIGEKYNDEGDMSSNFMKDFKITFIDNQFQESVFFNKKIKLDMLIDASYSESFLNKLQNIDFENDNSIIIIYDFKFNEKVDSIKSMRFIGNFNYKK